MGIDITREEADSTTSDTSEEVFIGEWIVITIEIPADQIVAIHEESHGAYDIPNHSNYRVLWNGEPAKIVEDETSRENWTEAGWEAIETDVGVEADWGFNVDDYEYEDRDR